MKTITIKEAATLIESNVLNFNFTMTEIKEVYSVKEVYVTGYTKIKVNLKIAGDLIIEDAEYYTEFKTDIYLLNDIDIIRQLNNKELLNFYKQSQPYNHTNIIEKQFYKVLYKD